MPEPARLPIFWIVIGAINGFCAVAAGAFGAHGLRATVPPEQLAWFELAARYQIIHALAIVAVGLLGRSVTRSVAVSCAGWLFLVGIVLFSGSLYSMGLTGVRWLGAVTPFGGVALLLGWAALAWAGSAVSRRHA